MTKKIKIGKLKTVLLNDTSDNNHYGCAKVVENIRSKCADYGMDLIHTVKLIEDWQDHEHLAKIRTADVVIVNGEGTMHHSKRRCMKLASVATYCKENGLRSYLINSVYQDNNDRIAEHVQNFDAVFVRESKSKNELKRQNIESNIVPDMFFATEAESASSQERDGLLFTDSVHTELSRKLLDRSKKLANAQFMTLNTHLPMKGPGARLNLLAKRSAASVLGNRTPKSWRREIKKSEKAADRASFGRYWCPTFEELFDLTARSQLVITGRFHMVCLALLARTPLVSFPSNSHKIEGLMEDVGIARSRLLSPASIDSDLSSYAKFSTSEVRKIDSFISSAKRDIDKIFQNISSHRI